MSTHEKGSSGALPGWIVTGVLGLALGAGGAILAMRGMGYEKPTPPAPPALTDAASGMAPADPNPMGRGGAGGGGGAPGGGMMGGMGAMMGMMGGGMGGGGGAQKRDLTSLVGKLELLTRGPLQVELDTDQQAKIAAVLAKFESAEKMTNDEAEVHLKALQASLTDAQKSVLESFSLPFGGGRGGGGRGGRGGAGGPPGGPPGAGQEGPPPGGRAAAMMAGMGGMGGRGGADPDENPFSQEANKKRLQDLLLRLKGQPAE